VGFMNLAKGLAMLRETVAEFMEDQGLKLAAATVYYAIFSIGPLLILVIGLAALIFGGENVRQQLGHQLQNLVGEQSARLEPHYSCWVSTYGRLLGQAGGGLSVRRGDRICGRACLHRWSFVIAGLATGAAMGLLLKARTLRRAAWAYAALRRVS
jgi:hypothetical protein